MFGHLKLGKKKAAFPKKLPMFGHYLDYASLPAAPPQKTWIPKIGNNWGMMKNDAAGDCTAAGAGHLQMLWTGNTGKLWTPSDQEVIQMYSAVSGYDPATGDNDNGAVETDVLNYWLKTGIGGHKIAAYAALEPQNTQEVMQACNLFGGVYIGVELPLSAQTQKVWSVPPGGANGQGSPGSWGGHCVIIAAYDPHGLTCITWGQPLRMTWSFWHSYCDEAFAIVSPDWIASTHYSPSGVDLNALMQDIKLVA